MWGLCKQAAAAQPGVNLLDAMPAAGIVEILKAAMLAAGIVEILALPADPGKKLQPVILDMNLQPAIPAADRPGVLTPYVVPPLMAHPRD